MLNRLVKLLGKSIQSEEVKSFLEENGFKYPKKDTITNRASSRYYWVEGKKIGINLVFSIEVFSDKHTVEKGDRKGVFLPILRYIAFNPKANIEYPLGINFDLTLDELREKLGESTWSRTTSRGSFHYWELMLDEEKDAILRIGYDIEDAESDGIGLVIKEKEPIIQLYDPLIDHTIQNVVNSQNGFYTKKELFFINWAVENDFLIVEESSKGLVDQLKSKEITIIEFVTECYKSKSFVAQEDFVNIDTEFIRNYYRNLSGHGIVYQCDFAYAFLKDEALRGNYLGKDAFSEMSKIQYTPENHKIIADIINQRYKEYQKDKFASSSKVL